MKNFTLILFICMLMMACKKESKKPGNIPVKSSEPTKPVDTPKITVKKYPTSWQIFLVINAADNLDMINAQGVVSSPVTHTTYSYLTLAQAGITNYYFIVYDSVGKEVSRIHRYANSPGTEIRYITNGVYTTQHSQLVNTPTTANFDTVTDSLPAGGYTIAIVAAASDISINTSNETQIIYTPRIDAPNALLPFFNYSDGPGPYPKASDTYFMTTGLTIPGIQSLYTARLARLTSELVVNIEGSIPANADHFRFVLNHENNGADLIVEFPHDNIDTSLVTSIPISEADKANPNYKYSRYLMNTGSNTSSVMIACYDASNKLIAARVADLIHFPPEKKIILTGRLFDDSTSGHINVGPGYGPDSTVVHF